MDSKTQIAAMSESMVEYELTKQGWHVFKQTTGKAPFDLVAYQDGRMIRVSVKSTQAGLQIDLRRIRSNKKGTIVHKFDATSCDIVACYLHEIKTVVFVKSQDVKNQGAVVFAIRPSVFLRKDQRQRMVHHFTQVP